MQIHLYLDSSVGNPDLYPQDSHVFGSPESGSIFSQRYGSGSGSFRFLKKALGENSKISEAAFRIRDIMRRKRIL